MLIMIMMPLSPTLRRMKRGWGSLGKPRVSQVVRSSGLVMGSGPKQNQRIGRSSDLFDFLIDDTSDQGAIHGTFRKIRRCCTCTILI